MDSPGASDDARSQRVHSVPMAPQVRELLLRLAPADADPDARVFSGQPRHEAAERLGRHFTGAAAELDALLGAPGELRIAASAPRRVADAARHETTSDDANSG